MILTADRQTIHPTRSICTRTLLPDEQEPGRLRRWLERNLVRLRLGILTDDLALIAGELAVNALRHGQAPARVTLTVSHAAAGHECVLLECTDSGPGFDPERIFRTGETPDVSLERCDGRGLMIVAALSSRWGCRRSSTGHVVWAEMALPCDSASTSPSQLAL